MNNYTNPYNPDVVYSYCEFWSRSGKHYKVFAFYYEDYTKTSSNCSPYQCGILTPNETGNWQYKVTATDNSVSIIHSITKILSFECISSSNKEFIVKTDNKFLKGTTGEFFFPVGQNVAWYRSPTYWGTQTFGTNECQYYIDNIAIIKANFIRVWLDMYEGMALVRYCNNAWTNRNSFNSNNGGSISTPFQFFSNSTAISTTKKLLKYIVSRWGFTTNLVLWELWNEANQIEGFNPNLTPLSTYATIY